MKKGRKGKKEKGKGNRKKMLENVRKQRKGKRVIASKRKIGREGKETKKARNRKKQGKRM